MMKSLHINFLIRQIGDGHAVQGNKEKVFVGENSHKDSLKFVEDNIKASLAKYKKANEES